jgi:hypothetical protein
MSFSNHWLMVRRPVPLWYLRMALIDCATSFAIVDQRTVWNTFWRLLRDWHEIDASSSEMILCDGAGDGGIDAAVFVREDISEGIEGDTWILVQSKYGSSYAGG